MNREPLSTSYDITIDAVFAGHATVTYHWFTPDGRHVICVEITPYPALLQAAGGKYNGDAPLYQEVDITEDAVSQGKTLTESMLDDLLGGSEVTLRLEKTRECTGFTDLTNRSWRFVLINEYKFGGGFMQVIAPDRYTTRQPLGSPESQAVKFAVDSFKERMTSANR